jgi:hypothetical protein
MSLYRSMSPEREEGNMILKNVHEKLLKNGYLPEIQNEKYEQWIDVCENGTPISFSLGVGLTGVETKGSFKIHGRRPDYPEADEFNSDYSQILSEAIRISRA